MCLSVWGWLDCEQLKQTDKGVFLNLHTFDDFRLIFPLACFFSFLWLCLVYLNCLVSEGVCIWLCSFFFSRLKAVGPAATNLDSVHITFSLHPTGTEAFMHACAHNQTFIGTWGAVAGLRICSSAEACTSFFNACVTSHPTQVLNIYSYNFLPCLYQDANKQTHEKSTLN